MLKRTETIPLGLPITLRIEKMIPGGKGLAFYQGRAVFIPQTVPGDLVAVQGIRDRGNYWQVLSFEILEPSHDRVLPPCPYFGECGGCDFQQMSYSRQLCSKRDILLDALRRIGKVDFSPEKVTLFSSPPLHYRNRIQLKMTPDILPLKWGFFAAGSHRVCEIDDCLLVTKTLWDAAQWLKELLFKISMVQGQLDEVEILEGDDQTYLVNLIRRGNQEPFDPISDLLKQQLELSGAGSGWTINLTSPSGGDQCIWGNGTIWKTVGEFRYRVSHGTFFQTNESMLEMLQERALYACSGRRALDLFSGVGFFALPLSKCFESVKAVEVNPRATLDLKANLEKNQVSNCEVVNLDIMDFLRQETSRRSYESDLLVLDPPRTGLPPHTVQWIAELRAKKLIYVSCDPSTLARDLGILVNTNYEITSIDLLDLFPQTHHLEGVVRLNWKSKKD